MEHPFIQFEAIILNYISQKWNSKVKISVDVPPDPKFGHISTNAALIVSKLLQLPVYEVGEEIGKYLSTFDILESYEITKHGFLNWKLKNSAIAKMANSILESGDKWGVSNQGKYSTVLVEYGSANPTGPLHVGHVRGCVIGDIISNLLENQGYKVTREYYINDYGNQVDMLIKSSYERYRQACGFSYQLPEDGYKGEYLVDFGQYLFAKVHHDLVYSPNKDEIVYNEIITWMLEWIRNDLKAIDICHDSYTSEKGLVDAGFINAGLGNLSLSDSIYCGETTEGQDPTKPPMLFKSTRYGDDKDRVVIRSNGQHTYFGGDVGYLQQKINRNFDRYVVLLGKDHEGYEKRLKGAASALSNYHMDLSVVLYEMVNIPQFGPMSKRDGKMITLRELLSKVDSDSIRFFMSWRKSTEIIEFDINKVTEQNKDNPLWYIQYANARINSICDKVLETMGDFNFDNITIREEFLDPNSNKILFQIMRWPDVVNRATYKLEPHVVALELWDLAKNFHNWYEKGKFIVENSELRTGHNLGILLMIQNVIKHGLGLLGIKPLEKM